MPEQSLVVYRTQVAMARQIIRKRYGFFRRLWSRLALDRHILVFMDREGWQWIDAAYAGHYWQRGMQCYSALRWAMDMIGKP
jgi:hypothetical protein